MVMSRVIDSGVEEEEEWTVVGRKRKYKEGKEELGRIGVPATDILGGDIGAKGHGGVGLSEVGWWCLVLICWIMRSFLLSQK